MSSMSPPIIRCPWQAAAAVQQQQPSGVNILSRHPRGPTFKVGPHFRAFFCSYEGEHRRKRWHVLEEVSRFVKEDERWWYVDGAPTLNRLKPRRNDPCLCGSGRKLKVCCGE